MLVEGENLLDGVRVEVVRKRLKHVNLRVLPDGTLRLSVPLAGGAAAMRSAEAFLHEKWAWALRARADVLSAPPPAARKASAAEIAALWHLLRELHDAWTERLGERAVTWRLSTMRSRWGVCNWTKRRIGYSTMLAAKPRELVEYVVVHELTHLQVHDHGPRFQLLMTQRLPAWRTLRRRLQS